MEPISNSKNSKEQQPQATQKDKYQFQRKRIQNPDIINNTDYLVTRRCFHQRLFKLYLNTKRVLTASSQ